MIFRWFRYFVCIAAALLLCLYILLATEPGMKASIRFVLHLAPAEIHYDEIQGTYWSGFYIRKLTIRSGGYIVNVDLLDSVHDAIKLLTGKIAIRSLQLTGMEIISSAADKLTGDNDNALIFPAAVHVDNLVINRLTLLDEADGHTIPIERVEAGVRLTEELRLDNSIIQARSYRISSHGTISLLPPYQVSLQNHWEANINQSGVIRGQSRVTGIMAMLDVKTAISYPATAQVDAHIRNIAAVPEIQASINVPAHTPDYLGAGFPLDEIGLRASVEGNPEKLRAEGNVRFSHPDFGQWNAAFVSQYHGDDQVLLDNLQITGAGHENRMEMQGRIRLSAQAYAAFLQGHWHVPALTIPGPGKTIVSESGHFEFSGNHDAFEVKADMDLGINSIFQGSISLLLNGSTNGLDFRQTHIKTENGTIDVTGTLDWDGDVPDFRFSGSTDKYLLTGVGDRKIDLVNSKFEIAGSTTHYILNAASTLTIENYPDADLVIKASGNDKRTEVEQFSVIMPKGKVILQGAIEHEDHITATLGIDAAGIDPSMLWKEWPGNITGRGNVVVNYQEGNYSLDIPGFESRGVLRQYPFKLDVNGNYGPGHLQLNTFELASGTSRLSLKGVVTEQYNLAWELVSPGLNELLPAVSGKVTSSGQLTGRQSSPSVMAELHAENIRHENYQAGKIDMSVMANLQENGKVDVTIQSTDVRLNDYEISEAIIRAEGTSGNHRIDFATQDTQRKTGISAAGSFMEKTWTGTIDSAVVNDKSTGDWKLQSTSRVVFQDNTLILNTLCLAQQSALTCGEGNWNMAGHQWNGRAYLQDMPAALLNDYYPDNVVINALIDATLEARGNREHIVHAEGRINTTKGSLGFRIDEETFEDIPFEASQLDYFYADRHLKTSLSIPFQETGIQPLRAEIQFGNLDLYTPDYDAVTLSGNIATGVDNLATLEPLLPHLSDVRGSLVVDLEVTGSVSQPLITGDILLSDGEAYLHELGIEVTGIAMEGKTTGPRGYMLNGVMQSGAGVIHLAAQLSDPDPGKGILTITLKGEDFEVISLPEVWALASPDISIRMNMRGTSISGEVTIPQARIDLDHIYIPTPVSEDVNIVSADTSARKKKGYRPETRIKIILGNSIEVTGKGVQGKLKGQLDVFTNNNHNLVADGEISMYNGNFSMYSQNLEIREARLLYNSAIIDDPELSVRAAREIGEITAGVRVTGRASDPVVTLFSTPSLSHEQILSYLVFGRPLASLTSGEGVDLISTATAMGLQNSGFITDSIANTFGLDDLKVSTGPDNQDTALILGKYLTPKLYISYGMGLFETLNTIRLKYDISRRWALQTESGTNVGVDLLYKIEK
jgi:translocation and assembly module TamB